MCHERIWILNKQEERNLTQWYKSIHIDNMEVMMLGCNRLLVIELYYEGFF